MLVTMNLLACNIHKPLLIFLSETKRRTVEMEWLRARWKFEKCFKVDCVGKARRLALLWMEEAKIEVVFFKVSY